jgi:uncharacterized protein
MNKYVLIGAVCLVVIGTFVFMNSKQTAISQRQSTPHITIGAVSYGVEVVDTPSAMAQGLSGRIGLPEKSGMLFVFDPPRKEIFWMQGMKFPIDIVWIKDGAVTGFAQDAPIPVGLVPAIFSSPGQVDFVFEVVAGTVAKDGIKVGDKVQIVR